jgi:hypothetical protein
LLWSQANPANKVLYKVFGMGCPKNMTEWQVAHWTKMSHERTSFEYDKHFNGYKEYNGTSLDGNVNEDRWKNKTTLRKDHEEDLNPLTKDWRESLRTWNYRFMALPIPPETETAKKKVSWSKNSKTN